MSVLIRVNQDAKLAEICLTLLFVLFEQQLHEKVFRQKEYLVDPHPLVEVLFNMISVLE